MDASVPAGKFIGSNVVIAARLSNPKGRDSGWSNFKTISVESPLADPTNFHAASDAKGVALSWNASSPVQVRIFRKTEQQTQPALLATATDNNYIDISAEYGKNYQYSIQAFRGVIESNTIGPQAITPIDTFPPAVPPGLTASAGIGSIELAWTRNTESDFKEYRVFRSEEGGAFAEIARGLDAPVYSDRMLQTGKRYRYQVAAADQGGHLSAPCAPVEIIAP